VTAFPKSPRLLKGGIVLMDPNTSVVLRMIALQYTRIHPAAPCRCWTLTKYVQISELC